MSSSSLVCLAALLAFSSTTSAQSLHLAADINTSGAQQAGVSETPFFEASNGLVYLAGLRPNLGEELCVTDGTVAGTKILFDIWPGPTGSAPHDFTEANGVVFFAANDGVHGTELWRTDGTSAGTNLVVDLLPGANGSLTSELVPLGLEVFFFAKDTGGNNHLWKSDGTAAGTKKIPAQSGTTGSIQSDRIASNRAGNYVLYSRLNAGHNQLMVWNNQTKATKELQTFGPTIASSIGADFVEYGNQTFFKGLAVHSGEELWVTDGTQAGTHLVTDLNPGVGGSFPFLGDAAVFGGLLYFPAYRPDVGTELWVTDGTSAGTQLVGDLLPGLMHSQPSDLTVMGNTLYFSAKLGAPQDHEIYSLTGPGGPVSKVDANPSGSSQPSGLKAIGGLLFFNARAAGASVFDLEPFVTDGTTAGTALLADLNPGLPSSEVLSFSKTSSGNVVFSATTPLTNRELFVTQGTPTSTQLLLEINPASQPASSNARELAAVGGRTLYFVAEDGVHGFKPYAWTRSGGAVLLDPALSTSPYAPRDFKPAIVGSSVVVFFRGVDDVSTNALWVTRGTPETTHRVQDLNPNTALAGYADLVSVQGQVYVRAFTGSAIKVWQTDGTDAGTTMVFPGGAPWDSPDRLFALKDQLIVFAKSAGVPGVWRYDAAGASLLSTLPGALDLEQSIVLGDQLLFVAKDANGMSALWSTDGTASGTQVLKDLAASASDKPVNFTQLGDRVAFTTNNVLDPQHDLRLWVTDGSTAGTVLLATLHSPTGNAASMGLTAFGDRVLFGYIRDFGPTGMELWSSDLTPAGTQPFATIEYNGTIDMLAAGDKVFLKDGQRTYATDGVTVTDLSVALPANSFLKGARVAGAGLYLAAKVSPQSNDIELYFSDGTVPGTQGVTDLTPPTTNGAPNPVTSSYPQSLTLVDGSLLMVATEGVQYGQELFELFNPGAHVVDLGLSGSGQRIQATAPILGGPVTVRGDNAPPGVSLLAVGPTLAFPQAQLVAPGNIAWIHPQTATLLGITTTASWSRLFALPANPALVGAQVSLQSWTVGAPGELLRTSNGLMLALGN